MRHCFDSHNRVALGFLFLIEALDPRIKADRKIGGLHKRPGRILLPFLVLPLPLRLPSADFAAADTPTVRSVIADTGKSPDLASFQHDGQRQDRPDSRYRL